MHPYLSSGEEEEEASISTSSSSSSSARSIEDEGANSIPARRPSLSLSGSPQREASLHNQATAQNKLGMLREATENLKEIEAIHLDILTRIPGYNVLRQMAFRYLQGQINLVIKDFVRSRPLFEKAIVPQFVVFPFLDKVGVKRQVATAPPQIMR